MLYMYSFTQIWALGVVPSDGTRSDYELHLGPGARPKRASGRRGRRRGGGGPAGLTVQGLPLIKPPYGRITAIDLNKGDIVWQVAHGETPDNIKNHPALKGLNVPRTGQPLGRIGTLTTKTLLVAGEPAFTTTANGQRGAMLRAYNKATGAEVGAVYMPAPQTGSPMTYMAERQAIYRAGRSAAARTAASCWRSGCRRDRRRTIAAAVVMTPHLIASGGLSG